MCFGLLYLQDAAHEAGVARDANHVDEAVILYRKVVAENPKWTEGWWYLGTLLYDRDDYSGAAAAFYKTTELDSRNGAALVMLGLSEAKLHENEAALKHLRSGRKLGIPDDPQLHPVMLFTSARSIWNAASAGISKRRRKRWMGWRAKVWNPMNSPMRSAWRCFTSNHRQVIRN